MPPVLDPSNSKVDGLAFLGLSLSRKSDKGHPDSETHQTAFDLNDVLDRDYEHIFSTNDDGWLVGGGEPGPPDSYKLAAKDSAHVEIIRIGTYRKEWGGVPLEEILEVMQSGEILIPQIEVVPTAVVANPDTPPELEIRFDMDPEHPDFDNEDAPLPVNWQLRFLHNQLFRKFDFPSRFCPGAFHSTILRKAEFRSKEARKNYFAKCDAAVSTWREKGVQPLNTFPRDLDGKISKLRGNLPEVEQLTSAENQDFGEEKPDDETPAIEKTVSAQEAECHSGIFLFTDRQNISHFFKPNFLPPYGPEKRKIIMDVLSQEWDEKQLQWKPCGMGSMTKNRTITPQVPGDSPDSKDKGLVDKMDEFVEGIETKITTMMCASPSRP
mmetsp:Transcript_15605/g.23639  ORF Transcript_15605/g.23639 Transcript_15605/m.23639 type:complete len:381 (-) Transcript_15605:204-1346(-)